MTFYNLGVSQVSRLHDMMPICLPSKRIQLRSFSKTSSICPGLSDIYASENDSVLLLPAVKMASYEQLESEIALSIDL